MASITVRNIPEEVHRAIRVRAATHDHSTEAEVRSILEQAARPEGRIKLGGCRTWGVESEKRPQRGQFLPDSQPHSPAMGQEDGEKWTAAVVLQPTTPKSDSLLGSMLASIAHEAGCLTDAEAETINQGRDNTPAEPMGFE